MKILAEWYNYLKTNRNESGNLVILITDFESFDPVILSDLIEICR